MEPELFEFYYMAGRNLAYYRRLCGLTQETLAELIDVDSRTVSRVETASQRVRLDFLYKASIVLKIPVSRFLEFHAG